MKRVTVLALLATTMCASALTLEGTHTVIGTEGHRLYVDIYFVGTYETLGGEVDVRRVYLRTASEETRITAADMKFVPDTAEGFYQVSLMGVATSDLTTTGALVNAHVDSHFIVDPNGSDHWTATETNDYRYQDPNVPYDPNDPNSTLDRAGLGTELAFFGLIVPAIASTDLAFAQIVTPTGTYARVWDSNNFVGSHLGNGLGETFNIAELRIGPPDVDLRGDVNGDGNVNSDDFDILRAHYGQSGEWTWQDGDLNEDGEVNVGDLGVLGSAASDSEGWSGAAVPEATTLALLVAGSLAVLRKQRRRD